MKETKRQDWTPVATWREIFASRRHNEVADWYMRGLDWGKESNRRAIGYLFGMVQTIPKLIDRIEELEAEVAQLAMDDGRWQPPYKPMSPEVRAILDKYGGKSSHE